MQNKSYRIQTIKLKFGIKSIKEQVNMHISTHLIKKKKYIRIHILILFCRCLRRDLNFPYLRLQSCALSLMFISDTIYYIVAYIPKYHWYVKKLRCYCTKLPIYSRTIFQTEEVINIVREGVLLNIK